MLCPPEEHTWQRSWVDDFTDQRLLWRLLLRLAAAAAAAIVPLLLLPQNSLQHC